MIYNSVSAWLAFPIVFSFLLPGLFKVSAAISSSGELKFLSEPTLSDTEPELMDAR